MGRYISIHRRPAGATRGGSSCGGVVRDRGVRAGPVPARDRSQKRPGRPYRARAACGWSSSL